MLEINKDPAAAFKRVCDFRIMAALLLKHACKSTDKIQMGWD
jgi:hypothetical protein